MQTHRDLERQTGNDTNTQRDREQQTITQTHRDVETQTDNDADTHRHRETDRQ